MVHKTWDVVVFTLMMMYTACQSSAHETTNPAVHVNNGSSKVTLEIIDVSGKVLERNSIPFGMNIKLEIKSDQRNTRFAVVPDSCYLISAISKRKYAILKSGCGDGIMVAKTDGFTIHNGTGFSYPFRAVGFSNDNKIKFSCNYTLVQITNIIKSCSSSTAMLKTNGQLERGIPIMKIGAKGNNPGMSNVVETRVIGLTFPEQYGSKLKRGNFALSNNGTAPSTVVENHDVSIHGRRLIFILSFLGLYVFILVVLVSIQIDRNKLEHMRNPML